MNSLAAANLFDNPLVLLVLVLLSALASWLMKRQQGKQTATRPDDDEMLSSADEQGRSAKPRDFEDAMRQLLGEEPPPQPPPLPPYASDENQTSPVRREAEPAQRERERVEEPPEAYGEAPPLMNQRSERLWQERILADAATRFQADERLNKPAHERPKPLAISASPRKRRRSNAAPWAVHPWRDPRTVRRAFIGSLVFAPPKGLKGDSGHTV